MENRHGLPFERYGNARIVLLGEATHGTSEFYQARATITRHLVERHGVPRGEPETYPFGL